MHTSFGKWAHKQTNKQARTRHTSTPAREEGREKEAVVVEVVVMAMVAMMAMMVVAMWVDWAMLVRVDMFKATGGDGGHGVMVVMVSWWWRWS